MGPTPPGRTRCRSSSFIRPTCAIVIRYTFENRIVPYSLGWLANFTGCLPPRHAKRPHFSGWGERGYRIELSHVGDRRLVDNFIFPHNQVVGSLHVLECGSRGTVYPWMCDLVGGRRARGRSTTFYPFFNSLILSLVFSPFVKTRSSVGSKLLG